MCSSQLGPTAIILPLLGAENDPEKEFLAVLRSPASQSLASKQNTTVTHGNKTFVSSSMKDNPHMQYYASIYALSMAVMLILKAIRGVVFVKVCSGGFYVYSP